MSVDKAARSPGPAGGLWRTPPYRQHRIFWGRLPRLGWESRARGDAPSRAERGPVPLTSCYRVGDRTRFGGFPVQDFLNLFAERPWCGGPVGRSCGSGLPVFQPETGFRSLDRFFDLREIGGDSEWTAIRRVADAGSWTAKPYCRSRSWLYAPGPGAICREYKETARARPAVSCSVLQARFSPWKVTLQPIRGFGFDASILSRTSSWCRIALGQNVWFEEWRAPRPTRSRRGRLWRGWAYGAGSACKPRAGVLETVRRLARELTAETTLLGFLAARPGRLASYHDRRASPRTGGQAPLRLARLFANTGLFLPA